MKELFDRFEMTSSRAEQLLVTVVQVVRERRVPSEAFSADIGNVLTELHNTYNEIRAKLSEQILAEEMPDDEATVREHESVWMKSIFRRQNAVRNVLSEFIHVYSEDPRYMDAIAQVIDHVKALLDDMEESADAHVDLKPYTLFLDGVKTDLEAYPEIAGQIEDNLFAAFPHKVVSGLLRDKYRLRKTDDQATEEVLRPLREDPHSIMEAQTEEAVFEPAQSVSDNTEPEIMVPDEAAEKFALVSESALAETQEVVPPDIADTLAEERHFIHPINPIRQAKLPSDQKMKELIRMTGDVLRYLLDKLVFMGLMDENKVFNTMSHLHKPLNKEHCIDIIASLENKGYLCTYEYEGRNILCFTELMRDCIQKQSLSSILKRMFEMKKLGKVDFVGKQNMLLVQFRAHLANVDQYTFMLDKLNEDEESLALLTSSIKNDAGHYFSLNLTRREQADLTLRLVMANEFSVQTPAENEGVLCYADSLPDMHSKGDNLHYCLTSQGLFQWADGMWIALTHIEEQVDTIDAPYEKNSSINGQDTQKTNIQSTEIHSITAEGEHPEIAVTDAILGEKQNSDTEQAEGLWLDSFSQDAKEEIVVVTEFSEFSATEIADRLLSNANIGTNPSDSQMAMLIKQLLTEGIRSYEVSYMHDQVVEAVMLAKLLAADDRYPLCRTIYFQLHAAMPMFKDGISNTSIRLTNVFAEETEYSSVTKLCAFIFGMLFPASAYDYLFSALCKNAFSEFDAVFPGLDVLKALYHKAMGSLDLVPSGFSSANLTVLSDSKSQVERMTSIQKRAKPLLKVPSIKIMINGVPELINLCFGPQTDLHSALGIVINNDISMRELVETEYQKYCLDTGEIDDAGLERHLDSQWIVAAQNYSSRRMGIKYDARKHILTAYTERLDVMREWLEETNTEAAPDIEKLRSIRTDILGELAQAKAAVEAMPDSMATHIMMASLRIFRAKLLNQSASICNFCTILRSGALVIENGEIIFYEDLNDVQFAEQWRAMLRHISSKQYDLRVVFEQILAAHNDSDLYDNFGQLEAIGRLIGADPRQYALTAEGLKDAIRSADIEGTNFREKLEISYTYNRISENTRERLAMLADSKFKEYFYKHRAFGCWRSFLNALRAQIRDASQHSIRDMRTQLEHAKSQLQPGETSALLSEAEHLIEHDQNYAVAEDHIHRFRNGEQKLPIEITDGTSTSNHFITFASSEVYTSLYSICERSKNSTLANFGVRYIESNHPDGWTVRNIDDAKQFLRKWLVDKNSVNTLGIQEFFKLLGFDVEDCTKVNRNNEACFSLTVKKSEQNQADYRHPISMFGTQMKKQIDVVYLFGKRTAKQLVDDACKLGFTSTFIVLLDANLPSMDRQKMAEYFFTQKNVGQTSFLVIDRVLALYLAQQSSNERLPAMLQCTLPYTIYQPFTNGSGPTDDEMFFGRVSELASIRDMSGTSIVYGGRQLGKTALLERTKHLDNNPTKREFAVMTSFKGCRGEKNFVEILIQACNDTFFKSGISMEACNSIRDFTDQINRLINNDKIAILRILLDETDDFLVSIRATNFNEILPLIDLQRNSNRRFKFVLAGLHNVCRTSNATRNNGLFGQLGAPLCIKPLRASDARNLLVRPLRYLGFRITNESHIDTILTNTNYYPGIIQYFGYTLVLTLASQYTQYYEAVKGNPPFDLHDDQLASIMNSRDLNSNIKDRTRLTLEMDIRYYMLARCVTVLYHLNGNDYAMISAGFDVSAIREVAQEMFDIHCLASLTDKEMIALLDEMEEMGIMSRPDMEENKYLLRRRSFIDVIGSSLEMLEHDIKADNKEAGDDD